LDELHQSAPNPGKVEKLTLTIGAMEMMHWHFRKMLTRILEFFDELQTNRPAV
jgi:hypothetical protein